MRVHSTDSTSSTVPLSPASMDVMDDTSSPSDSSTRLGFPIISGDQEESELIDLSPLQCGPTLLHERVTAPLFTRGAYVDMGGSATFPSRGLLGTVLSYSSVKEPESPSQIEDPRIYVNTNAPFSAVICGVQGSGKSHTVSVLLENMLIPNHPQIGSLFKPLSGLVLHYGEGGPSSLPSEAAWLGVPDDPTVEAPQIRVYVSKSSLSTMKAVYQTLNSDRVVVEPLLFSESELDAQAFLTMMAVQSKESAPLYVQLILSILRELGENFTYQAFIQELELKKQKLQPQQRTALKQRMDLLNSFLDQKKSTRRRATSGGRFSPGCLTIVDLSDPFIDATSACNIFEIITRQFVRADTTTGKVLLVDEAHKYLQTTNVSSGLTKELTTLIRQQRHLAMRVIISTQEPNVLPPVLLDLCGVTILHRFSSPSWWDHLSRHAAVDASNDEAYDKILELQTGQAIVISPAALVSSGYTWNENRAVSTLGRKWLLIKTRKRITRDGGRSIMVVG